MPPSISPRPIGAFIWELFNRPEHLVSLAQIDHSFYCQDVKFLTTNSSLEIQVATGVTIKYFLHGRGSDKSIPCGSLCPPIDAGINQNMLQHLFGIEFHYENHTHVHVIFPFKFSQCIGYEDNLTYWLSHPVCKFALDAVITSLTSEWIFDQVHTYLIFLRDLNCEMFSPNQWASQQGASNHLLMVLLGLEFLPIADKSRLTTVTSPAMQSVTWCLTQEKFATRLYRTSTMHTPTIEAVTHCD
jgi:hypothetical protein